MKSPDPPAAPTMVTVDAVPPVDAPSAPPESAGFPARYEDRGRLGAGAIGEVHRVYDRILDAELAMKILRTEAGPDARARFHGEARITARLRHPGIVAVQDLGVLADGRPWYTMEEVHGRTFTDVIRRREGGLRRLMDAWLRTCEAVAYAHAQGVVHRDLKPDNVMIGAFGEVRVMDWGLARILGDREAVPRKTARRSAGTLVGSTLGTPGFMPPEQADGRAHQAGPPADVYALGAMLYLLLAGVRPYAGLGGRAALAATVRGPPADIFELAPDAPPPLLTLCAHAMARAPEDRPANAGALLPVVRDWLEGARKEAEASALVTRALERRPEVARLMQEATALAAEAAARLDPLAPHAPVAEKLPGWRLEQAAEEARVAARRVEEELHRDLRAALGHAPELRSAHEALADLYRDRLIRAEASGEPLAAADAEALLREHDRGQHARWLRGDGALSLVTDPPGATVDLFRFVERDRRLVEEYVGCLGQTPIREAALPRGSHLVRLSHPARATVRYPVCLERLEHWDGVRPGSDGPWPILLPVEVPAGECYVPAGWFAAGGDLEALDGLPARRLWVDAFFLRTDPVTNAEYLEWLDALLATGGALEAALLRPANDADALVHRVGDHHVLGDDPGGLPLRPEEPVVYVTPEQAEAYVAWRAARDGVAWRLPHDLEWEKAARGVDRRAWPWGNRFEPTWTRMQTSLAGPPRRATVGELEDDVGVYGMRGAAGNTRDICQNAYSRGGPTGPVVEAEPALPDAPYRVLRGGAWTTSDRLCRVASRTVARPGAASSAVGLRLARSAG